jgi:hypothetical protein
MRKAIMKADTARRTEYWRERIAQQERSGVSVHRFCEEQGLTEQSFYVWRKRLRQQPPARFALVETGAPGRDTADAALELVLTTGERLRIGSGADPTALRTVLEALRA